MSVRKKNARLTPQSTSLPLLKALRKSLPEDRGEILKNLRDKAIDSVGQYVFNLAHSNLPMKNLHKRKMKTVFEDHLIDLRPVMNCSVNVNRRRTLLVRQSSKGGALEYLLKIGLPYLERAVSSSSSSPVPVKGKIMKKRNKLEGAKSSDPKKKTFNGKKRKTPETSNV